jgi:heme exporter protein B
MITNNISLYRQIVILLRKEMMIEFRLKSSLFSLMLYLFGIAMVCYLSFYHKTSQLSGITWNALFWISQLFIAINGIGKSFIGEPKSRNYYYYVLIDARAVILSKIIYNMLLVVVLSMLSYGFMRLLLPIEILNIPLFMSNLALGVMAFSVILTLVSAIASKANNNATLMAILSIPLMIPVEMLMVKISNHAIDGLDVSFVYDELLALGGVNILIIGVSYILFPYLWRT